MSLSQYLNQAGLSSYATQAQKIGVTVDNITSMTVSDIMSRLNITSITDRRKLFEVIQRIRQEGSAPNNNDAFSKAEPIDLKGIEENKENHENIVDWDLPQHEDDELQDVTEDEDAQFEDVGNNPEQIDQTFEPLQQKENPMIRPSREVKKKNKKRYQTKIRVCVRKRPMNEKEKSRGDFDVMECHDEETLVVHEPKKKVDLTEYVDKHTFSFDEVFHEGDGNDEVYERTAQPLVEHIFTKGKATCFAYGQTGSGKTYTMMGKNEVNGLYLLAAVDMFNRLDSNQKIIVSYYEIYGGKLFDLLNNKKQLMAREDGNSKVRIVGIQEHPVDTVQELMQLIAYGNSVRATGSTGANEDSSRSHAILQISIKSRKSNGKYANFGKFSFVDLAGSERGADTYNNNKQTRLEGAQINKSLLALKECIRGLDHGHKHIPFRGSKLTEVLRDSFVGNSKTVMIANISPNSASVEHSLNTLRYADRVKEITRSHKKKIHRRKSKPSISRKPSRPASPSDNYSDSGSSSQDAMDEFPVNDVAPPKQHIPSNKRPSKNKKPSPDYSKQNLKKQQPAPQSQQQQQQQQQKGKQPSAESLLSGMGTADLERAHEELINKILEEEEVVIAAHRQHIDEVMEYMKSEMRLLHEVEQPGSAIDAYVTNLDHILVRKIETITQLRNKLAAFQAHLREEEILSRNARK